MIEPNRAESKKELVVLLIRLISIRKEVTAIESGKMDKENNALKNAPHTAQMMMKPKESPYSREEAVYPLEWLRGNKFWPVLDAWTTLTATEIWFVLVLPWIVPKSVKKKVLLSDLIKSAT